MPLKTKGSVVVVGHLGRWQTSNLNRFCGAVKATRENCTLYLSKTWCRATLQDNTGSIKVAKVVGLIVHFSGLVKVKDCRPKHHIRIRLVMGKMAIAIHRSNRRH